MLQVPDVMTRCEMAIKKNDRMQRRSVAVLMSLILWTLILVLLESCILSSLAVSVPMKPLPRLLILGLGRVGHEVALNAKEYFHGGVWGTIRAPISSESAPVPLSVGGINVIPLQLDTIQSLVPTCTHILVTIPPPRDQAAHNKLDSVYDCVIDCLPRQTSCWIGVISTTGVYGDHQGGWVTEQSECYAITDASSSAGRFWKLEHSWRERLERYRPSETDYYAIFRCAGIYGPGRSALHTVVAKRSREGDWIIRNETLSETGASNLTNRIHSTDLARAVVSWMMNAQRFGIAASRQVFNLADDMPEDREVVMGYAHDLLVAYCNENEVDLGRFVSASPSMTTREKERTRRRRSDQKRVNNTLMKDMLLGEEGLIYPTYKEGLQSLLKDVFRY